MATDIFKIEPKICTKNDFEKEKTLTTPKAIEDKNGIQIANETYTKVEKWFNFKTELKWMNILHLFLLHVYLIYVIFNFDWFENWKTTIWSKCTCWKIINFYFFFLLI